MKNVIKTDEISDHDLSYIIINIRKQRFQPRYKYIRGRETLFRWMNISTIFHSYH